MLQNVSFLCDQNEKWSRGSNIASKRILAGSILIKINK